MNKYIINGGKKLNGEVNISGSKNATLPIMAASILTDEDIIINNAPFLRDIQTMVSLLVLIGKKVILEPNRLIIRNDKPIKGYQWIVRNPNIFDGKPLIKGTRFSVSFVLECLSEGMDAASIEKTYGTFPKDCITEVLKYAAELTDKADADVAA